MATTRRLLERVPTDRGPWKPHPKSFPLGHLAQLVSWMPGWIAQTLRDTSIDLAAGGGGYGFQPTETLVAEFDRNVRDARAALESVTGADLDVAWSLKRGEMTLMSLPRMTVIRQTISHLSHHRGQMTVYLRMNDIPVPSIYGPTADERPF